ncbi:uncharacterized protein Z518_10412 [Rhinocladiella mackenziei CBS 650.93]|uniref:Metallo-beta-lactamase domain-containing protein n=1 Tax=Rhinocladiella mackenziei CBS 650.93 TaxID=1442369 RepID=A0A0D2GPH5_9EURO|nr:uncharacterized protein Z518_10412 [Rhinocladiella mackenziei CBS 650.93]KIX00273.1 hypothetical protein Z518_10412 [Rhinocladiella mackenziei CBS 650.93]
MKAQQTPQERPKARQINSDLFPVEEVIRARALDQTRILFPSALSPWHWVIIMSDQVYLVSPKKAPELHIPASSSCVDVRLIDTTTYGKVPASLVFTPALPGYDMFTFPSYSFLISNSNSNKHVLFDLGMRKDWETALPPKTVGFVKQYMPFTIEANLHETLDEDAGHLGITSQSISTVIWSHHHFDHRGDITAFPSTTELVVGPGFTNEYVPAYPTNPESSILETELQGRPIRELDDASFTLKIGQLPAHDLFGDGSFYILSAPGHTIGHLCALARVSNTPIPSFVFIGGDCAHYPGIFRPTEYLPLPKEVPAAPGSRFGVAPCPGMWIQEYVHPKKSATEPFLGPNAGVNEHPEQADHSVSAMEEFDANEDILVCIAHDPALLGNVDFYPKKLNDWKKQEKKEAVKWSFCGDFDVRAAKKSAAIGS